MIDVGAFRPAGCRPPAGGRPWGREAGAGRRAQLDALARGYSGQMTNDDIASFTAAFSTKQVPCATWIVLSVKGLR